MCRDKDGGVTSVGYVKSLRYMKSLGYKHAPV